MTTTMLCYSLVVLLSLAVIYVITQLLHWLVGDQEPVPDSFKASWLFSLVLNLLGYASVLLPGLIIYKYVKTSQYLDRAGKVNLARQLWFSCLAKSIWYLYKLHLRQYMSEYWTATFEMSDEIYYLLVSVCICYLNTLMKNKQTFYNKTLLYCILKSVQSHFIY